MRFIINLVIKALLLLGFNALGWLTLMDNGTATQGLSWATFGNAIIIAVVFAIISLLVMSAWVALTVVTGGIASLLVILLPFLGYWLLQLTQAFLPGGLQTHGFWITALCGFLLLIDLTASNSD